MMARQFQSSCGGMRTALIVNIFSALANGAFWAFLPAPLPLTIFACGFSTALSLAVLVWLRGEANRS